MTNKQKNKLLCVDNLRHAEYYQMQDVFDELYAKSKSGEVLTNLMPLILSRENILLAYRNIKTNSGSKTHGTDNVVIDDIGKLSTEEYVEKLRYIVEGSKHGWGKCAVTGKEFELLSDIHCHHIIPKQNGGTDKYENLVLVLPQAHRLIHATDKDTIEKYLLLLELDKSQLARLNKYRELAGNRTI